MTRPAKSLSPARTRLLVGASAFALATAGASAFAAPASNNPFARTVDPAARVAAAVQAQATQNSATTAASQQALAAFAQAAALRSRMDAAQVAARAAAAAASSSVPNGLTIGGLQVAPGAAPGTDLWQGADAPTQTSANGRTEVTVNQTASQAILNWQTFNVGQQTDLTFGQANSSYAVLNRVNDPSANPTQILGTIKAPGTVLIMNQNGVIFGGASQVNVGALVAGAANITDSQFLNSGIYSTQSSSTYLPSITDVLGSVTVQAGAQLTTAAPSSVEQGGGYVMLLGGQVENDGSITTPFGQTLLAAGDSFLLRPGYGTTANQYSTTLGSEIAPVIGTTSSNGAVTNAGEVYSQQGDITLAGRNVTQAGVLLSTTSVSQRGTIHLLNSATDNQGLVTLAPDSVTAILPELDSTVTAPDANRDAMIASSATQDAARVVNANAQFNDLAKLADRKDQSRVEIVSGNNVDFQGGSYTLAQGGQIAVSATNRILTESGAWLDVSGVRDVALNVTDNAIQVNIQGNELRDDPNNRDASGQPLYSQNVWVNINDLIYVPAGAGGDPADRYYTPGGLLEVSGWLGNTGHTIGEWDSVAGTITLQAKEVVAQQGAMFNIAGGSLNYAGGVVPQSYLVGTDGQLYNVNTAPADLTYAGVYTGFVQDHPHWGVSQSYQTLATPTSLYQPGYTVGRDAGSLILSSPTVLFNAAVDAEVIDGAHQTTARPAGVTDGYKLSQATVPLQGQLNVGQAVGVPPGFNGGLPTLNTDVRFTNGVDAAFDLGLADPIPATRTNTAWFDASQLSGFNLGGLSAQTVGAITVDAPLTLASGGGLTLYGSNVSIAADVTAHGGSVTATANGSILAAGQPATLSVAPAATLDTTGLWTNGQLDPNHLNGLAFLNGGAINLSSTGDLIVGQGSLLDASSGAAILPTGATVGGTGGAISLVANSRPNPQTSPVFGVNGLVLDGTVRSYGVIAGGALTLQGNIIAISDTPQLESGILPANTPAPFALALASTQLSAGDVAPINVPFGSPTTLPAGTMISFNLGYTTTVVPAGQAFQLAQKPSMTSTSPVTTMADWTVPSAWGTVTATPIGGASTTYSAAGTNKVVPAGASITAISANVPVGTVVPGDVFPSGIPVPSHTQTIAAGTTLNYAVTLPAGAIWAAGVPLPVDVTLAAGATLPAGTVFSEAVNVMPVLNLSPGFFQQGFSSYAINGVDGLTVMDGTQVQAEMPVLRFTSTSRGVGTGFPTEAALELWTPPLSLPNPVKATLNQRGGASVSLSATSSLSDAKAALGTLATGTTFAPLTIGEGASIAVDPGQSINLAAWGEIDVEGALTAPGGTVTVLNTRPFELEPTVDLPLSIWIGSTANIDVSGAAFTAQDLYGRVFGSVTNGGSITLGSLGGPRITGNTSQPTGVLPSTDASIILRPGSVLDASGASAVLDLSAGSSLGTPSRLVTVNSNGGSIALSSYSGLYLDGAMLAKAGGPDAAGGTLSLTLETPIYSSRASALNVAFTLSDANRQLRILSVDADYAASAFGDDAAPGQADAAMLLGSGHIAVSQIEAGGFDNLSLFGGDATVFNGNVTLALGQSLTISDGRIALSPSTPNAQVSLTAPYVMLNGDVGRAPSTDFGELLYIAASNSQATQNGILSINANLIDIANPVAFGLHDTITLNSGSRVVDLPSFSDVNLTSQGDIRFLPANNPSQPSTPLQFTSLVNSGDITLGAERIYPVTNATAYVVAGAPVGTSKQLSPTGTLTIERIGSGDVTPPDSVFGHLLLLATDIEQGGVVMAPLGGLTVGANDTNALGPYSLQTTYTLSPGTTTLNFLPGSITSVSADGLNMPYGGTSDGINYLYNGAAISLVNPPDDLGVFLGPTSGNGFNAPGGNYFGINQGIMLGSESVNVQSGALIDVSGGGNVAGAGFITGRGGSIDVLHTALANSNPTVPGSKPSDQVFAIIPGFSGYAPVAGDATNPAIGQQVTVPAGVPGLPAGTYTLLPATYALQPGAYRVELGGTTTLPAGVASTASGSYNVIGYQSVANTDIRSSLPTTMIVTPADGVRSLSQYNEASYSDFARAQAAQFGTMTPLLPIDTKLLVFDYGTVLGTAPVLSLQGTIDLAPGSDSVGQGRTGLTEVFTPGTAAIEIRGPDQTPTPGMLSFDSSDFAGFARGALVIGGYELEDMTQGANVNAFSYTPTGVITIIPQGGGVTVNSGATLAATQMFLVGGTPVVGPPTPAPVNIQSGATLTTLGQGPAPWDSVTDDILVQFAGVALSNGSLTVSPINGARYVTGALGTTAGGASGSIASGATLLSENSIALTGGANFIINGAPIIGTENLVMGGSTVNIGSSDSLAQANAAGVLPAGWSLNQDTLDVLVNPAPGSGIPALQNIIIVGSNSINFVGSVDLSTTTKQGAGSLTLDTPALYGLGSGSDIATLTTGTFTWSGVVSNGLTGPTITTPGAVTPNGLGTGSGELVVNADRIVLGFPANSTPYNSISVDRLALGFSSVTLNATSAITANNVGTLSVYQSKDALGSLSGGALNLVTPLLTVDAGAKIGFTTGGALNITAPSSGAASTSVVTALGGEVDLTGGSVVLDTAVALPSGKLSVTTTGDIQLGANATIDLSGRSTAFFDQTSYSWGGDAIFESATGNITQDSASRIDVSAANNNAGTVTLTATDPSTGQVLLAGQVMGWASDGFTAGGVTIRAQQIGSDPANLTNDFAALNAMLDAGGVFGARTFSVGAGDLTVGDVTARKIDISVNGGSLTVSGTLNASGPAPGTIRLAAMDDLTLGSASVLDAHGTVLQADSTGAPIDAENRGHVELTSTVGTMTLSPGATIDVSSPESTPQGDIELNVARTSETGGDAKIVAFGPVTIKGAQTVAVNAFWTYAPTDANGSIIQDNQDAAGNPVAQSGANAGFVGLNQIDARSRSWLNAALVDADLIGRLSGLTAYSDAFHLRPGVQVQSATPNGSLSTVGNLDFSGFRYASLNSNTQQTSLYGSGEPGDLVIRAGGNLNVNGSISDGFLPAVAITEPVKAVTVTSGTALSAAVQFGGSLTLQNGSVLGAGFVTPVPVTIGVTTINAQSGPFPFSFTISAQIATLNWVAKAPIHYPDGTVVLAGQTVTKTMPAGTTFDAGTVFPSGVVNKAITAGTVIPAGTTVNYFAAAVPVQGTLTLPAGTVLPSGSTPIFTGPAINATQVIFAPAPPVALTAMLSPGLESWSMRLVSGADLGAANTETLLARSELDGQGNMVLNSPFNTGFLTSTTAPPGFSVVRTGTGSLDILAGGNFSESSLYGIYTAGSQSPDVTAAYNLPQGTLADGTVTGAANTIFNAQASSYQAYYPTGGGDLLLVAQGDVGGFFQSISNGSTQPGYFVSNAIGDWLWRQGGAPGQSTAWWINFGAYDVLKGFDGSLLVNGSSPLIGMVGFTGVGTLGGGNLTVIAGGNAGVQNAGATGGFNGALAAAGTSTTALNLFVGSSGRVLADGSVEQTGGGALTLKVGGRLNSVTAIPSGANGGSEPWGVIGDLRGDINIQAGSIGQMFLDYATKDGDDPRQQNPFTATHAQYFGGLVLAPGDSTVNIDTRGDLALGTVADPGRTPLQNTTTVNGSSAYTWFTLWQPDTAVNLVSAGGNVAPENVYRLGNGGVGGTASNPTIDGGVTELTKDFVFPSIFTVTADGGSIYYGNTSDGNYKGMIELAPSPDSTLSLLAQGSIYGSASGDVPLLWAVSGASPTILATPQDPGYEIFTNFTSSGGGGTVTAKNFWNSATGYLSLFNFGPDTATSDVRDPVAPPARFYAATGDIYNLRYGDITRQLFLSALATTPLAYVSGAPLDARAGRDIVNLGTPNKMPLFTTGYFTGQARTSVAQISTPFPDASTFILNYDPTDVSVISAGRDIIYANVLIGGPGNLEVTAGRNIYQGDHGLIESIGPVFNAAANPNSGAGILVAAGLGPNGPNYTDFATLYFNAANASGSAEQAGKVVATYQDQLVDWLNQNFSASQNYSFNGQSFVFDGNPADALAFFLSLPPEQQALFVLPIYFDELKLSGREFNDPSSKRFKSYARGREAIATLFPTINSGGASSAYSESITLASGNESIYQSAKTSTELWDSGIHTDFGGGITLLAPGGGVTLGATSVVPGTGTGLLTQGSGDIDIYSQGSIPLGLSRVFTTFGGDITMWSADGDINAGRGAKTAIVAAPIRVVYDDLGHIATSPTTPTSGAGIATLAPIPEVPSGDIDLIAPLGTVDAGEAGIRVSGNLNIAALQVLNAANIQVQGTATGIPQAQAVNVGALTSASSATAAVTQMAAQMAQQRPLPPPEAPTILTIRLLGFGDPQ